MNPIKNKIKIVLIVTFLSYNNFIHAQIKLVADSIFINDVITTCPSNIWIEDFIDPPILFGYFRIINETKDTLLIDNKNLELEIYYIYSLDDVIDSGRFIYIKPDSDTLCIYPNSSLNIKGSSCYILGLKNDIIEFPDFKVASAFSGLVKILPNAFIKLKYRDKLILYSDIKEYKSGHFFRDVLKYNPFPNYGKSDLE